MTAGSTMPFNNMESGFMGRLGSLRCRCTMLLIFSLVNCIVSTAFSRGLISSCETHRMKSSSGGTHLPVSAATVHTYITIDSLMSAIKR